MHKKNKRNILKEITEQIVISFFFVSIIILIIHFVFIDKINNYINIVNMISIEEKDITYPEVKFDNVSKRLKDYPLWGKEFATLDIPSINVNLPVFQGDTLDIMRYGIGHYSGSLFPGEGGTIILAGHNDRGFLYHLPEIKVGDKITINAVYGTFTYEVESTRVIDAKDNDAFPFYKDKEVLMIYTCYPVNTIGHKTHRFLVYAKKVGESYEK